LIFVVLYGIALARIRRKEQVVHLDLKDRILLSLALGESILILLYHILFNHLILLFVIRLAKMLEQVTICFIILDLTLKRVNLNLAFRYSCYTCLFTIFIVACYIVEQGN